MSKANAEPAGGGGGAWADPTIYQRKSAVEQKLGRKLTLEEFRQPEHWVPPPADQFSRAGRSAAARAIGTTEWVREKQAEGDIEGNGLSAGQSGTSVFDPVICEIAYRWFCPPGGLVFDPFAGGSVRGIIASALGRRYIGIELRQEQVEANYQQMALAGEPKPEWRCGDARNMAALAGDIKDADLIFSCPPYWTLERYSDDPADLSTMPLVEFDAAYRAIIAGAAARLRNDRFCVWVVSDVRDERGYYINLPGRTVSAFEAAGMHLYNDAILITAAGSLPIRVAKQFEASRKLGRTHQNVQVYVKGDPRKATEMCGKVEFGELIAEAAAPAQQTNGHAGDIGGEV